MDNNNIAIPVDAEGEVSMLIPPELLMYLNLRKEEIEANILSIQYDIEMPRKDIVNVIHMQGQLKVVSDLLKMHERAFNANKEA